MKHIVKLFGPLIICFITGLCSFIVVISVSQATTQERLDMHIRTAERDSDTILRAIGNIESLITKKGKCDER